MARRLQATYRKITELAARSKQVQERDLLRMKARAFKRPIDEADAMFSIYRPLSLCYWWMEEYDQAHTYWRLGLEAGLRYVDLTVESIPKFQPEYLAERMLHCSIIANLLGDEAQSIRLLEQTERFAAGLAPGMDRPQYPAYTLDRLAKHPVIRTYAFVRLKRLDGLMATTFLRQWPDAIAEEPDWRSTEIFSLLHTCEVQLAKSRTEGYETFPEEKWTIALLRVVARAFQNPSPGLKQEAQEALVTYLCKVQHPGHFVNQIPLVLDLQTAFPDLFAPILPPPRP